MLDNINYKESPFLIPLSSLIETNEQNDCLNEISPPFLCVIHQHIERTELSNPQKKIHTSDNASIIYYIALYGGHVLHPFKIYQWLWNTTIPLHYDLTPLSTIELDTKETETVVCTMAWCDMFFSEPSLIIGFSNGNVSIYSNGICCMTCNFINDITDYVLQHLYFYHLSSKSTQLYSLDIKNITVFQPKQYGIPFHTTPHYDINNQSIYLGQCIFILFHYSLNTCNKLSTHSIVISIPLSHLRELISKQSPDKDLPFYTIINFKNEDEYEFIHYLTQSPPPLLELSFIEKNQFNQSSSDVPKSFFNSALLSTSRVHSPRTLLTQSAFDFQRINYVEQLMTACLNPIHTNVSQLPSSYPNHTILSLSSRLFKRQQIQDIPVKDELYSPVSEDIILTHHNTIDYQCFLLILGQNTWTITTYLLGVSIENQSVNHSVLPLLTQQTLPLDTIKFHKGYFPLKLLKKKNGTLPYKNLSENSPQSILSTVVSKSIHLGLSATSNALSLVAPFTFSQRIKQSYSHHENINEDITEDQSQQLPGPVNQQTELSSVLLNKTHFLPTNDKIHHTLKKKYQVITLQRYATGGDTTRIGTSIQLCPCQPLLAIGTDQLGRVFLLHTASLRFIHLWKGYRHAQVSWVIINIKEQHHKTTNNTIDKLASLTLPNKELGIVIYCGKKGILEIWRLKTMTKIGVLNVGLSGILTSITSSLSLTLQTPYSFICLFISTKGEFFYLYPTIVV